MWAIVSIISSVGGLVGCLVHRWSFDAVKWFCALCDDVKYKNKFYKSVFYNCCHGMVIIRCKGILGFMGHIVTLLMVMLLR
jgi:hypothetical protein